MYRDSLLGFSAQGDITKIEAVSAHPGPLFPFLNINQTERGEALMTDQDTDNIIDDELHRVWALEREREESRLLAMLKDSHPWPGFDLEGVFHVLKPFVSLERPAALADTRHIEAFYKVIFCRYVLSVGGVPFEAQAPLAASIVAKASAIGEELTSWFIRESVMEWARG